MCFNWWLYKGVYFNTNEVLVSMIVKSVQYNCHILWARKWRTYNETCSDCHCLFLQMLLNLILCNSKVVKSFYRWFSSSIVNIVTETGLSRNHGLIPGRGKSFFSSPNHPGWSWGSPGLIFSGYWAFFCWTQSGCHMKLNTPSSAEVKNEWSYNFIPQYAFMACSGETLPWG